MVVSEAKEFEADIAQAMLHAFGFCRISGYAAVDEAREGLRKTSADLFVCDRLLDVADVAKAAKRGDVDCFFTKPFSPRTLLDRIVWSARRENRRNPLSLLDTYISSCGRRSRQERSAAYLRTCNVEFRARQNCNWLGAQVRR